MQNEVIIRSATVDDGKALLDIYQYYVLHTAISFEYDVPSIDEFRARIARTLKKYPYAKGQGIGKALYEEMERRLKDMGILNLYACIGLPDEEDEYLNKNSAQFHEHMGFRLVGTFYKCGRKFDRWYHMIWMEKIIGEHR